jgi:hypothetical protein
MTATSLLEMLREEHAIAANQFERLLAAGSDLADEYGRL